MTEPTEAVPVSPQESASVSGPPAGSKDPEITVPPKVESRGNGSRRGTGRGQARPKNRDQGRSGASPGRSEDVEASNASPVTASAGSHRAQEVDVDDLLGAVETPPPGVPGSRSQGTVPVLATLRRVEVRAARRLQARKVGRLIRHVELWSLLKVALLFYVCMLLVGAVVGVLVWSVLQRSGAVASTEGFIEQVFLLDNFRFEGTIMFRLGILAGLIGVLVLSLVTVLGGLLFNLISDLTGGIRVSVVELESARPLPLRGRS